MPPLTATIASSSNTPTEALCAYSVHDSGVCSTHVHVPFACSPVCPDAQILNLSDSAQWAGEEGANTKALSQSGQHMTWRELEEALETSTSSDHVRRVLALNKHLLHGLLLLASTLPTYSFVCPSMLC